MEASNHRGWAFAALLLFSIACGGKTKTADDWAAPDREEGKAKQDSSSSGSDSSASGPITAYDDVAAGLHIEIPCRSPEQRTSEVTLGGAIRAKVVNVRCSAGGVEYGLEYWRSADLIGDQAAFMKAAQQLGETAFDLPPGWKLAAKTLVEAPAGWTNLELRATQGDRIRVQRMHMLLPRRVILTTTSTEADSPNAERFLAALRVREEGTPYGREDTGFADRTIELPPGKMSVLLPCVPKVASITREKLPAPLFSAQLREFECHHPSGNVTYSGMYRRFDRPGDGSPDEMKIINRAIAEQLAKEMCATITASSGAACTPGDARPLAKGNGSELRVTTAAHATARIVADYPSVGFILVVAPKGGAAMKDDAKVPDSIRQAELEKDRQTGADEIRTLASLKFTSL